MSYAATVEEIMSKRRRADRHAELVAPSDQMLRQLEELNIGAYPPPPERMDAGPRRVVGVPADLAQAVNELLIEVGLEAHRLSTTSDCLDAVWAAQRRLFGQPDEEEENEP